MYVAINLDKTQYPTPTEVLHLLLPVKCSETWSVLTYLASAHPGKQVECLSSGGVLTGHSIKRSVSVITNMTANRIYSLAYEMNTGGGRGILQIFQLLFYTAPTVRYYTTISLFMDYVHPVRSNRQSYSYSLRKKS
jgi:hypothetical protein